MAAATCFGNRKIGIGGKMHLRCTMYHATGTFQNGLKVAPNESFLPFRYCTEAFSENRYLIFLSLVTTSEFTTHTNVIVINIS